MPSFWIVISGTQPWDGALGSFVKCPPDIWSAIKWTSLSHPKRRAHVCSEVVSSANQVVDTFPFHPGYYHLCIISNEVQILYELRDL